MIGTLGKRLWLGACAAAAAVAVTGGFGGSTSTADAGDSLAPRVASTAAGQCSQAEAIAAVRRLGLRDVSATYPVWKVLCGAFAGAESKTMVVSINGDSNLGMLYWAVFRWSGSEWQLLMKQRQAAILTAARSDIRQTVSIYRVGDPRCCPSGGTRARIWHWNGARFVAGPWKLTQKSDAFFSPSRNIFCWMNDDGHRVAVGCVTFSSPREVTMGADGRLKIRRIPASQCGCVPDGPRTLAYGEQTTVGRFRCLSLEIGVKCTVIKSGKGFLINRDGISRIGP